ncbi:MAG TPA: aminotransferase class IV [Cyclobacteriaceae bacterium]|jgi:branched-chain amino acid aminotransferase|nr:aminotransferase class IV family protein [Cytophagales bacterium]HNT51605.1 aminotransferase class IV [Cyclobacteriaceae bacterium]HRE66637.1 aminotransferase class IV [Cyclobacteriaceae bacterium]HRF35171.1 aminotransferase class IV [Cyclobacteriaceae bacterium]
MYSFLNTEFLPAEKTFVHVSDLAVQRGYGIFDFLKAVNGKIPFIDDYFDRFYRSAEFMQLPVSLTRAQLKEVVYELVQRNGEANAGIKMVLTGGYSPDGYEIATPNLIITQHALPMPSAKMLEQGVKIITHEFRREMPLVKSINYTTGVWLQRKVKEANAYDVLYHLHGEVSEFPRCNLFVVKENGHVVTPAVHVLEGITRKNILSLREGITVVEGKITLDDIWHASEVFLTSTTKRVVPIVQVDDVRIGTGKPGPVVQKILNELIRMENRPE